MSSFYVLSGGTRENIKLKGVYLRIYKRLKKKGGGMLLKIKIGHVTKVPKSHVDFKKRSCHSHGTCSF